MAEEMVVKELPPEQVPTLNGFLERCYLASKEQILSMLFKLVWAREEIQKAPNSFYAISPTLMPLSDQVENEMKNYRVILTFK